MNKLFLISAAAAVVIGGIYLANPDRKARDGEIGVPAEVKQEQIEITGEARPEEDIYDTGITFEHVVPGEYSEIYVRFKALPNTQMPVVLNGADGKAIETQPAVTNEAGEGHTTFRITQFGNYMAGVKTANFTVWLPIEVK